MTDFASLLVPDRGQKAHPIHLVDKGSFEDWLKHQSQPRRGFLKAQGFDGKTPYQSAVVPGDSYDDFEVVTTVADVNSLSPWCLAKLPDALPEGSYRLAKGSPGKAMLGWLLSQHRFDRFKSKADEAAREPRVLVTDEAAAVEPTIRLADATVLVRDLVNTPALELGPEQLEKAIRERLDGMNAEIEVTSGDKLEKEYPLIAAVGAAAARDRAPRLVEARWGNPAHPKIAIVGKGVCFDSGGLDIKGASGMRIMKKDMGGAAHALAIAWLVMAARLSVRLHLLIPAVENAVSGNAIRPGDIVKSRKGLNVEIDNTDAEGRLILADALAKAAEDEPELIVDFATLTGAARVALGPDLPALFASNDDLCENIEQSAREVDDPVWRMPLWDAYDEMLKSDVADLANSANSPMAGAVVAAMFMKRFLPKDLPWAHLDTWAWRDTARPGRPKGGEALGLRAVFDSLARCYPAG